MPLVAPVMTATFQHLVQTAMLTVPVEAEFNGVPGSFRRSVRYWTRVLFSAALEFHRPPEGGRTAVWGGPGQPRDAAR